MDIKKDKNVVAVREGAQEQGQQQPGVSQDPAQSKSGKWATNVEIAVTPVSGKGEGGGGWQQWTRITYLWLGV